MPSGREMPLRDARHERHHAMHWLGHIQMQKAVTKGIKDIMEGAYAATGQNRRDREAAETAAAYKINSPEPIKDIAKEIKRLEEKMHLHAL